MTGTATNVPSAETTDMRMTNPTSIVDKPGASWVLTRNGRWAGPCCEYQFIRITEFTEAGIRKAIHDDENILHVALLLNEVQRMEKAGYRGWSGTGQQT